MKIIVDIVSGPVPFNERPQGKKLIEAVDGGEELRHSMQ
jgi:hypothetical protein